MAELDLSKSDILAPPNPVPKAKVAINLGIFELVCERPELPDNKTARGETRPLSPYPSTPPTPVRTGPRSSGPAPYKEAVRFDREYFCLPKFSAAAPLYTAIEGARAVFNPSAPNRLGCESCAGHRWLSRSHRPGDGANEFTDG